MVDDALAAGRRFNDDAFLMVPFEGMVKKNTSVGQTRGGKAYFATLPTMCLILSKNVQQTLNDFAPVVSFSAC